MERVTQEGILTPRLTGMRYAHFHHSLRFTRLRLLVALACVLLATPVGTLRAATNVRLITGMLSETESRPQSEYETESEVLLDARTSSRRTREAVRSVPQTGSNCEPSQSRLKTRGGFPSSSRSAEFAARNGCGAVLRC
jgi:hypothetical protein